MLYPKQKQYSTEIQDHENSLSRWAYPCMIINIANFSDWKFEEHIYRPAVGWKYPNIYRISNLLNLFNILYF